MNIDSVSSGDYATQSVSGGSMEYLVLSVSSGDSEIADALNQTNLLVGTILFFLVFMWVEKRIKSYVRKVLKNDN